LEGTSIALATHAADSMRKGLGLVPEAFSYLSSHGSLDIGHMETFRDLMDRVDDPDDQQALIHRSRMAYRLYTEMFRELPGAALTVHTGSDHAAA
ncbi:biliverdin-producing heme oxygenase, partial [Pseudomonas syringae]